MELGIAGTPAIGRRRAGWPPVIVERASERCSVSPFPAGRRAAVDLTRTVAGVGVALAVAAFVVLELFGAGRMNLFAQTISDYIVLPAGAGLIGVGAAGLVAAALAAAANVNTAARRVLVGWCAAVVLIAVLPTNLPDEPVHLAAQIHRWAGALCSSCSRSPVC